MIFYLKAIYRRCHSDTVQRDGCDSTSLVIQRFKLYSKNPTSSFGFKNWEKLAVCLPGAPISVPMGRFFFNRCTYTEPQQLRAMTNRNNTEGPCVVDPLEHARAA